MVGQRADQWGHCWAEQRAAAKDDHWADRWVEKRGVQRVGPKAQQRAALRVCAMAAQLVTQRVF